MPSIESILIAVGVVLVLSGLLWAYDRWIRPRMMRRWIDKTLGKIRAGDYVSPPEQSDCALSFDAAGITVTRKRPASEPAYFVAWSNIVRVVAFKRDLFTVDCICLAFAMADGMTTEVNEEMEGWEALAEALPEYLPGSKIWSECFSQVAFPAFATNETVMFERASSTMMSKCGSE
ncbi:MAG: hypothetical protein U0796_04850 [Gemmatales bacterium]